jgi:hypothetical protein
MQTFVPYTDLDRSAAVLDSKRLNKQLLEGRQIYGILASGKRTGAWVNHPAVKMWRNYDMGLYAYLRAIKDECVKRGIQTEKNWTAIEQIHESNWHRGDKIVMPAWWDDFRVHDSHKYNLNRKDPDFYGDEFGNEMNWTCCDGCNYFWPTHTLLYNADII